jgi:hypothetical protein
MMRAELGRDDCKSRFWLCAVQHTSSPKLGPGSNRHSPPSGTDPFHHRDFVPRRFSDVAQIQLHHVVADVRETCTKAAILASSADVSFHVRFNCIV